MNDGALTDRAYVWRCGHDAMMAHILETLEKTMKPVLAHAVVLFTACAGLAGAETGATRGSCPLSGLATDTDAECQAQRAAFRERMTDCMARRVADAEALVGGEAEKSSHAARARYLLCSAEVSGRAAPVLP